MLAGYLLQAIERQSDQLTEALIKDLTTNERTPSFRRLPMDALRERSLNIYRQLSAWLAARSEAQIDVAFEALGRQRFGEQIPLEELVYAIVLTRHHVRDKIHRVGETESAIELHYEQDLDTMMGMFFDHALYATVKGYEQARRVSGPTGERREQWAKFGARGAWVP
jgi:hypothetical protein